MCKSVLLLIIVIIIGLLFNDSIWVLLKVVKSEEKKVWKSDK